MSEDIPGAGKSLKIPAWMFGLIGLITTIGTGGVVYGQIQLRIAQLEGEMSAVRVEQRALDTRIASVVEQSRSELQLALRPVRRTLQTVQINTLSMCQSMHVRCSTGPLVDSEE